MRPKQDLSLIKQVLYDFWFKGLWRSVYVMDELFGLYGIRSYTGIIFFVYFARNSHPFSIKFTSSSIDVLKSIQTSHKQEENDVWWSWHFFMDRLPIATKPYNENSFFSIRNNFIWTRTHWKSDRILGINGCCYIVKGILHDHQNKTDWTLFFNILAS